jgi:hypothetical protein
VYFSTEDLVKGQLPQFAYQLHLASGEVEKSVKDEQSIRQFLRGLYGARGPNGELAFDPEKGVLAENLPLIGESRILNGKVSSFPSSLRLSDSQSGDGDHEVEGRSAADNCLEAILDAILSLLANDVWKRTKRSMARQGQTCT